MTIIGYTTDAANKYVRVEFSKGNNNNWFIGNCSIMRTAEEKAEAESVMFNPANKKIKTKVGLVTIDRG